MKTIAKRMDQIVVGDTIVRDTKRGWKNVGRVASIRRTNDGLDTFTIVAGRQQLVGRPRRQLVVIDR